MNEPVDDIIALCARFNLDRENYRVFPKKQHAVPSLGPLVIVPEIPVEESLRYAAQPLPSEAALVSRVLNPAAPAQASAEQTLESSPDRQSDRAALRNLWSHVQDGSDRPSVRFSDATESAISILATAGGVGSTTIAATLACLLSRQGKFCAVADHTPNSLLPFFFSNHPELPRRHAAHASVPTGYGPAVRIISPDVPSFSHNDLLLSEFSEQGWIERELSRIGGPIDQLIAEFPVDAASRRLASFAPKGATVAVAVPDIRCMLSARTLKNALSQKGAPPVDICVLNKFDAQIPIHSEVLGWFQENFRFVVTLSRSDLAPESLAEGMTVVDWAPDSRLVQEFGLLLGAIEGALSQQTVRSSTKEYSYA